MGRRELSVAYAVEYIVAKANDRALLISERQALLDALDAVPREFHEKSIAAHQANVRLERDRAERADRERDELRKLLVSAEGYALAKGADRPFVCMFAEDAPQVEIIERAGCYPRSARRENPGRFFLNPPPDEALSADADADAEPEDDPITPWRHPDFPGDAEPERDPYGVAGPCEPEPSRAEGDEHCHACDGDGDAEDPCVECGRGLTARDLTSRLMPRAEGDATTRGGVYDRNHPGVKKAYHGVCSALTEPSHPEGDDGRSRAEPLRVGDRLHANPCNVVVTARPTSSFAYGRCDTCDGEHILDAAMFDRGRGPWRREGGRS